MRKKHKNKVGPFLIFIVIICVLILSKLMPILFPIFFPSETSLDPNKPINILLLGIGGGNHDGPLLTDTIIFASIDTSSKSATLISIPRDLWVPDLKGKVNRAYSDGESVEEGSGLLLAKAAIQKVVGQPVDYVIRIDFSGFEKGIDALGGIDVDVERSFDDYEYPVAGKETDLCGNKEEDLPQLATASSQLDAFPCRYMHIHFEKGMQHMDGQKALQFVRSRHAIGPEGTDFARSKRQEKVIQAVRNNLLSAGTLLNPGKLSDLYSIVEDSIHTDISQNQIGDFTALAPKLKDVKIKSAVLDQGNIAEGRIGLLTTPTSLSEYGSQWVLIPKAGNGNFNQIHEYVVCVLKNTGCAVFSPTPELTNED